MKRILHQLILIAFILSVIPALAQPWMRAPYLTMNGPQDEWKRTNFYEIQKAFNAYKEDYEQDHPQINLRTQSDNYEDEENTVPGMLQYKRWEYHMRGRWSSTGDITEASNTWQIYQDYVTRNPKRTSAEGNTANWVSLGPATSFLQAPTVGRVNFIRFHPTNSNIIWAGSASGGLWKTIDGGTTWSTNTDGLSVIGCSDLAINLVTPTTMYLATGDSHGNANYSIGVLKTTDGGATWNPTGLSWNASAGNTIFRLIIDPTNPNILLAATLPGLYRTSDAGVTWTQVLSGYFFTDVKFKPGDPTTVYAVEELNSLLHKSVDGGITFSSITAGLPTTYGKYLIGVSAANPSYVYMLRYANHAFDGLYRSIDGGTTFTLRSNTPDIIGVQGEYDMAFIVNPTNADDIYVGGLWPYRSIDGGTTWLSMSHGNVHGDIHSFEFLPGSSTTLYMCNDGGINKNTSNGSITWTHISNGLSITQVYKIGTSATNAGLILEGAQDNNVCKLNGTTWNSVITGDGMESIVDYTDASIVYSSIMNGALYKSIDGGNTFTNIVSKAGTGVNEEGDWVTPFIMNPVDHNTLLVGKTQVYRSTDAGSNWSQVGSVTLNVNFPIITSLEYAPSNTNYIYVAAINQFFVSTDGNTFTNRTSTLPSTFGGFGGLTISDIVVSPTNPSKVWISAFGYTANNVYVSSNGGQSWTDYSAGLPHLPTNSIIYQNSSNDGLYLAMDVGVYYRNATMSSWALYNIGLPNVEVREVEIQYSSQKIRAATYGRGVWESNLSTVGIEDIHDADGFVSIYPNPAHDYFNIATSMHSKNTSVSIFNTVGEKVYQSLLSDRTMFHFDYPPGIYFVKISDGEKMLIQKLLVE